MKFGLPYAVIRRSSQSIESSIADVEGEAVAKATQDPKIQEAFIAQGAVAVGSTPAELDQVVKTEVPMWKELAKKANIQIN